MTSWCHVLPVPRLDTHQEDPGNKQHTATETKHVHVQLTCSESDIYPRPNSPGKPHRALLSSASLWKVKSLIILMIVQMLDAPCFTPMAEGVLSPGGRLFPVHPEGRLYQEFPVRTRKILVSVSSLLPQSLKISSNIVLKSSFSHVNNLIALPAQPSPAQPGSVPFRTHIKAVDSNTL